MYTGLGYLGEQIALKLQINNPLQRVGEVPTYLLTGAPPGQMIAWTSYKNGEFTGELNSTYDQIVEPNGTARLPAAGPWREEDIGTWQKIATFSDGSSAIVNFQVVPAASVAPSPAPVSSSPESDWFSSETQVLGYTIPLPPIVVYGVGGYVGYQIITSLFGKKR